MKLKHKNLEEIIRKVKSHKKYSSISDDIVKKEIKNFYKRFGGHLYSEKEFIKKVRARLHRFYSSFQTKGKQKRTKLLEDFKKIILEQKTNKNLLSFTKLILSTMLSTKERLDNYPLIYKNIFRITEKPKIIIDLGSGINPLSFPLMNISNLTYYAYDIDEKDIKFLNEYFKIMEQKGLKGKAKILDITNINDIQKLQKSDIVFIFKVLDFMDNKTKENLITTLIKKTEFIIASFPTRTITRKPMNFPRRKGFELMLKRNNLKFKIIKTNNETFYVISR
jgi:hypothetical protein